MIATKLVALDAVRLQARFRQAISGAHRALQCIRNPLWLQQVSAYSVLDRRSLPEGQTDERNSLGSASSYCPRKAVSPQRFTARPTLEADRPLLDAYLQHLLVICGLHPKTSFFRHYGCSFFW